MAPWQAAARATLAGLLALTALAAGAEPYECDVRAPQAPAAVPGLGLTEPAVPPDMQPLDPTLNDVTVPTGVYRENGPAP